MAAFTASQASINNGSKVVKINSGESIANVGDGDFLVIANFIVEINRAYVSATNEQLIELVENWPNSNQNNQKCIVIPTTGAFKKAVDALTNANLLVNNNFTAMQDWQTKTGTVTFSNQDGTTTTVKTLKQIEADNLAQMNAYHPYPWAMRGAEYVANQRATNANLTASGLIYYGKTAPTSSPTEKLIANGLYTMESTPNVLGWGRNYGDEVGDSKSAHPELNVMGNKFILKAIGSDSIVERVTLKFPTAEAGLRTYDTSSKVSITHATAEIAFASETDTNKVVTDREDLATCEVFLRKITDADPFVYPDGAIQSVATKMSGIATVQDNVRPQSYFAMNKDDTATQGRGINWKTANESVRRILAADPANKIRFNDQDGQFYQWCVRFLTFAGLGNGSWRKIDSEFYHDGGVSGTLSFDGVVSPYNVQIMPQGIRDENPTHGETNEGFYQSNGARTWNFSPAKELLGARHSHRGVFIATSSGWNPVLSDVAADGQCYMFIIGTVNRLNQGLYHPSLNPMGSGKSRHKDGTSSSSSYWFENSAYKFTSRSECFNIGGQPNKVWGYAKIDTAQSGRPDGRYFDCIYSSGAGGFGRDMRYSAHGVSSKDLEQAYSDIRTGKYRGREELEKVTALVGATTETDGTVGFLTLTATPELESFFGTSADGVAGERGKWYQEASQQLEVYDVTKGVTYFASHYWSQTVDKFMLGISLTGEDKQTGLPTSLASAAGNELVLVKKEKTGLFVSGEFIHTVVIGPPSEINQCNDLKDGWIGDYVPLPPTATTQIKMPKPMVSTPSKPRNLTLDYGATWTNVTAAPDLTQNTLFSNTANSGAGIEVYHYTAKASPVVYSSRQKRLKGTDSIQNVWFSNWGATDRGSSFIHSLIKKVPVGSSSYAREAEMPLTKVSFDRVSNIFPAANSLSEHGDPQLEAANSPAAKVLPYWSESDSQMANITFEFTELVHNTGTDWGDDGKVHIAEKLSTMTDDNNQRVYLGTAITIDPLGHVQNEK